jgi:hypothetical protein
MTAFQLPPSEATFNAKSLEPSERKHNAMKAIAIAALVLGLANLGTPVRVNAGEFKVLSIIAAEGDGTA